MVYPKIYFKSFDLYGYASQNLTVRFDLGVQIGINYEVVGKTHPNHRDANHMASQIIWSIISYGMYDIVYMI